MENHCIPLPTSLRHDTGADARAVKSARAFRGPSTVEKAPYCGQASKPSKRPKDRCLTRPKIYAMVYRAHRASQLLGIVCRSYLPQASDRVWTGPIPQTEPTKVKFPDVNRIFNRTNITVGGGGVSHAQDPSAVP